MFTDMIGYTALGQRNESLSLALVDEQRKLLRPIFGRHYGREIKTIGDAFLVEFPSALEAVRCAYDVQRATREFNISLPSEKRVHLRVGVHLGDVVESEGDIAGDAVNVASRVESLAEDGGVCLTHQVYDNVQGKFELPLTSLGSKPLKNVSAPLEIFKMVMPWSEENAVSPTRHDKNRVAILPLVNMSNDPNDEFFADGMTEQMISTLSRIRDLKVIARTSIMQYKGVSKGVAEIGRALNVGTVLEGSVRKASNRLRITVQLISTDTEEHLWAEDYDRDLEDVFALQSEIAEKVAEQLQVKLLGPQKVELEKRSTSNVDAFTLYLKGRYYWNERTGEGMTKAITYFEKAIEKDPGYALAYSGMADCYDILASYGLMEPGTISKKWRELTMKALELDDTLAEAHASMAGILYDFDWEWSRAEAKLRRAVELNPNYATARHWLCIDLAAQGKHDEAISQIRMALELDPLSKVIRVTVAAAYWEAHRDDEAIEELKRAIEADADFYNFHDYLGMIYAKIGRAEEGIVELEKAVSLGGKMLSLKADLGYAYARAGKRTETQEVLEELRRASKNKYVSPLYFAQVYVGLGEVEGSLAWIEKAFQERAPDFISQVTGPIYNELRSSPRFMTIIGKLGLT